MGESSALTEREFETRRLRMVDAQLNHRGISDLRVLEAMRLVPRHRFVPEDYRDDAYADHPLPIGYDQTISQPFIVASMSQELRLRPTDRVLEVGTGCGYQTAVLSHLADRVFSIEIIPELLTAAQERLRELRCPNVTTRLGDGCHGWPEEAPFDAILVAAAAYALPNALSSQLADSGRMIIPLVSEDGHNQDLVLFRKQGGELTRSTLYGVRFVPLCGSE